MRIELVRRPERSTAMAVLSPVIAVALTLVLGAIVFAASGVNPLRGLYVYFIDPLTHAWSLQELVVKAIPIVIIAGGLIYQLCVLLVSLGRGGDQLLGQPIKDKPKTGPTPILPPSNKAM